MRTLQRYIGSEIFRSVFVVLIFFLALLAFFDLLGELKSVGQGAYKIQHAFLYVALELPSRVYEFMPIAVLIGTILTLVQLASRSEFTIMRASSMSTTMIGWALIKIGVVYVLTTFLFGEVIAPYSSELADHLRVEKLGGTGAQEFRSGQWTKDLIRSNGLTGDLVGSRTLNVLFVGREQMNGIKAYEFDKDFHLTLIVNADRAEYQGNYMWKLINVTQTHIDNAVLNANVAPEDIAATARVEHLDSKQMVSEITPQILRVSTSDPDNMTAFRLWQYARHLEENNQNTALYDIAFWKKLINPFATLVMMALALPFAYLHTRAGGTSLKAFIGIMIGVSFILINHLFSYMGLLNTWPPFFIAILPSVLYLVAAVGMLQWGQRR